MSLSKQASTAVSRLGERLYRFLLLAYPGDFRRHYGNGMTELFRSRRARAQAEGGLLAVPRFWVEMLRDLLTSAIPERLESWRRHRTGGSGHRAGDPFLPLLADLGQDVRYSIRTLRRSPGFMLVVTLTLALGIGANTAIFSLLRTVLLRPLAYPEPDRLVTVWTPQVGYSFNPLSGPDYRDYREAYHAFEAWGAYVSKAVNLSGGGDPIRVPGIACTSGLLRALGIAPAHGRLFQEEEAEDPGSRVAIVSDRLWKGRFGADPALIGREIVVNRENRTVVPISSR